MNPPRGSWAADMLHVQDVAARLFDIQVITLIDALLPEIAANGGDLEARGTLRMLETPLRAIQEAPVRRPMLCGACPRSLRDGRFSS